MQERIAEAYLESDIFIIIVAMSSEAIGHASVGPLSLRSGAVAICGSPFDTRSVVIGFFSPFARQGIDSLSED